MCNSKSAIFPIGGNSDHEVAFDMFCPSKSGEVSKRTCLDCGIYHPSVAAMKRHMVIHRGATTSDESVEEDDGVISKRPIQAEPARVYRNMFEELKNQNDTD